MSERRIIALAVDGSEHSEYAFDWYVNYLHRPGQEMIVLYVPEDCNLAKIQKEIAKGGPMKESIEMQYSQITELEDKYHNKLAINKINGRVLSIPSKNAGNAIIEATREENAFALVMGTRGRNKLKKVLLGSVSDFVVKNADVPVIVVRKQRGGLM